MIKKYGFLLSIIFLAFTTTAQNAPFITTWEVQNNSNITIPTVGTGYDYTVDFGDGTILNNQTGNATHTYPLAGIYTVTISGSFPRIYFAGDGTPEQLQIKTIEQWGDIQWQSMEKAFEGCLYLSLNATDAPDLSQVTNISEMFAHCWNLNSPIDHWDVSTITNMSRFLLGTIFNQPLNSWDVSNVINMSFMFHANDFNQPLDSWNVSNVTDMSSMFSYCSYFNQDLNMWNVSNVVDMTAMFSWAENFNQPLNNWNVSNVTKMGDILTPWDGFGGMFEGADAFNQDLSSWDVSNVEDFSRMFALTGSFNQDLSNWDMSSATLMEGMFERATSFNQPLNSWDVSNVSSMKDMFRGIIGSSRENTIFNQPLNEWDVSNVTNMENMFREAGAFNQDLSDWQFSPSGYVDFTHFLSDSNLDRANYDNLLINLSMQPHLQDLNMGAVGVEYCNLIARSVLVNIRNWTITGDILGDECIYNKIVGLVAFDEFNDYCDSYEISAPVNDIKVTATDGINIFSTFVNNSSYILPIDGNNFTVQLTDHPAYFSPTPNSQSVVFAQSDTETANFCMLKEEVVKDLNISFLPIRLRGLGYEADYRLVVKNVGTEVIPNTEVNLTFEEDMVNFMSADPAPVTATNNQLTFNTGSIRPFETKTIDVIFTIPGILNRYLMEFTATISPEVNDATPEDNTFNYIQDMHSPYAPINKQVLEGDEILIGHIDQYLHYLIPFQNTTSASVVNVRILDTLDSKLDWDTFQPVNASHTYRIEITDGNRVEFIFENIHLSDSTVNEEASHGFVSYKIKPKQNIQVGDVIYGNATLYFDFNEPITTNTVFTEVVDNLGVGDNSFGKTVIIYPNPVNGILYILPKNGIVLEEVAIYNVQGRLLLTAKENLESLDLSNFSSGVYLMKLNTNQGEMHQRLIKR